MDKGFRTCLIGCLGIFILLFCVVAFSLLAGYLTLKGTYEAFTDAEPMAIKQVQPLSDYDKEALQSKLDNFTKAIDGTTGESEFTFTPTEINNIFGLFGETQWLTDTVYIEIDDDLIKGEISFPLSKTPLPLNRFINGKATFDIQFQDGKLEFYIDELNANGKEIPVEVMEQIIGYNFADDIVSENPDAQDILDQLEEITVGDGKVKILIKK